MITPENTEAGVNEASRILNNFDIPRGLVREGESSENFHLNYTQWTTIGDIKNRRYYWWTEYNRRMRMVDLKALDFEGGKVRAVPLDESRREDIRDRTPDLVK